MPEPKPPKGTIPPPPIEFDSWLDQVLHCVCNNRLAEAATIGPWWAQAELATLREEAKLGRHMREVWRLENLLAGFKKKDDDDDTR